MRARWFLFFPAWCFTFLVGLALWVTSDSRARAEAAVRQVGAARVDITPDYPVRLSGYGNRRTYAEGVKQHLYAKALAIGNDEEGPAILLTVDNCGVPGAVREEVARRLAAHTKVTPDHVALSFSHTHCAPMLSGVLPNLFSMDLPAEQWASVERYTRELTDKLEQVALAALQARTPCRLAFQQGSVGFAANRRIKLPFRPVDHDLPVLRVTGIDGRVRALFASYACHCTTIGINFLHGDWEGCAQADLEKGFPGAVALTALGCGADQNPSPRGTIELTEQHGAELAAEVKRVAGETMKPLNGPLHCYLKRIELPYMPLPTREEWERRAQDTHPAISYHAKKNLARLDQGEALPTALPYVVQVWAWGDDLAMVFLAGEVTVDYGLRLKKECDASRIWINGYSNDAPCYIPSERVLAEGGYEGAGAMVYYDRPAPFAPGIENRIISAVHELLPKSFAAPASAQH